MDSLLVAYISFAFVLVITPGSTTAVVVRNTLAGGSAAGIAAAAGAAVGNSTHATAAGLGLALVFARWPIVMTAVRIAGALFLAWLGAQSLYRAADQVLFEAKTAGRDRIVPTGWQTGQNQAAQRVDIALVDDDEALGGLLLHALETRGYRVVWLQDGTAAVEALGGLHPRLQARIILLDVDLPSLDGLTVLRHLAHDGVVQRTRVIMLTFRSSEDEILKALQLGAFDHIAKPFSLPVLMQRIRRTLQA